MNDAFPIEEYMQNWDTGTLTNFSFEHRIRYRLNRALHPKFSILEMKIGFSHEHTFQWLSQVFG